MPRARRQAHPPRTRARQDEEKLARREALLAAAVDAVARGAYARVTMASIAQELGLAKGTVYLYFPSKEALFLAAAERELGTWFDAFDAALAGGALATPARVAGFVARSLAARPVLVRLLGVLQGVLEHNIAHDVALAFKRGLHERLTRTAAALEAALPALPSGSGVRVLLHLNALVVGLALMADVSPVVRRVHEMPGLRALHVDFATDLTAAATALLAGATRSPEPRP